MKKIYKTFLFLSCIGASTGWALQKPNLSKQPILLKAQDISNDELKGLVIARGKVQISNGIQTVEADTITYNKKLKQLTAAGNVKLFDIKGDVVTSNYAELQEDLQEGFLEQAYLFTSTKERMAASKVRKSGLKTIYENGVYSPCKMCKGQQNPTWELQAQEILRDEESGNVTYKNALLAFKGVPILGTLYLSHPDPMVKRRTGVLVPFFAIASKQGATLGLPYYWAVDPSQNLTVTPVLMTKQKPALMGDYERLFEKGSFHLAASGTQTDSISGSEGKPKLRKKTWQGHLSSKGLYEVDDNWRMFYDVKRTTSPTYVKQYTFVERGKYAYNSSLTSFVGGEGFYGRDYVAVKGYDFQTLKPEVNRKQVPTVFPLATYQHISDPGSFGQYWTVDASQLSLRRDEGNKMDRLSSTVKWSAPYASRQGYLMDTDLSVRGDAYHVNHVSPLHGPQRADSRIGRALPTAAFNWRMPFINRSSVNHWLLEPRAGLILSPRSGHDRKIPNEDSLDFEYDVNKLFLANRMPGLDLMDAGQRGNYGVNMESFNSHLHKIKAFLGQGYSFSKTSTFLEKNGVHQGLSDYLGRLHYSPISWLNLYTDTRLRRRSLKMRRNQTTLNIGPDYLNASVHYLQLDDVFENEAYSNRKQVAGSLNGKFTDTWSGFISGSQQLAPFKSALERSVGVIYSDDCFTFRSEFIKTYYRARDVKPATAIMFTFTLKNLGEFSTGRLKTSSMGSVDSIRDQERDPNTGLLVARRQ